MFTTSVSVYMENKDGERLEYVEGSCLKKDIPNLPKEGIANGSKVAVMNAGSLIMFDIEAKDWLPFKDDGSD